MNLNTNISCWVLICNFSKCYVVCFCKNLKDLEEITDTANEVIKEEIGESEEGEVLFGSADVIINNLTVLMLQYTNSELPRDEMDEIIDLLTEPQGAIH